MGFKKGRIIFIAAFFIVAMTGLMSPGLAMILTGFWLIAYVTWIIKIRQKIRVNGENTAAVIIKNENNSDGILVSHYEFVTIEGKTIQGKGFTNSYEGEKGEIVEIIYNATTPNEFILKRSDSSSNKYLYISILIAIFLFFCITGYLLL